MQPRGSIIGSGLSSPLGTVVSPNRARGSIIQPQLVHTA